MKRFYKQASVAADGAHWRILLDGRAVRSQGGRAQLLPSRMLAEAMAAEWAGQGDEIDPSRFPCRDLADYAIDAILPAPDAAIRELLPYAETDTLCYRAEPGEALHRRQLAAWEPILTQAEHRYDVAFTRVSGIIHQAQPAPTLARLGAVLAAQDGFTLAALKSMASLAASLTLALAALEPGADVSALWDAACLEEDWQAELWGKDAEAETRRARRAADFAAAARFAGLVRGE